MNEDEFLNEPFLTEDGFLNEACWNELCAAIASTPPTYIRLADDPEWSAKRWIHYRDIVGSLAFNAISLLAGTDVSKPQTNLIHFPPGLESVLGFLSACIRPKFNHDGLAELSLCDINQMLHEYLMDLDLFKNWNRSEVMGDYWLSLDALLHQVCIIIRNHWRQNDAFDRNFEERCLKK